MKDLPLFLVVCSVFEWTLAMLFLLASRDLLLLSLTNGSFVAVGIQIRYVVMA